MENKIKEILFEKEGFFDLKMDDKVCAIAYLYLFFSGEKIFAPRNIKKIFDNLRDDVPSNIPEKLKNLSSPKIKRMLSGKRGEYKLFTKEEEKWEEYFSFKRNSKKNKIENDLKDLLPKIKNKDSKDFLEEAIDCFNIGAKRATIILVWILTINTLQENVFSNKTRLNDFNVEWLRRNTKNKRIRVIKDFSDIKEETFIETCRASRIIDNNERKILVEKLGTRNTASHPNLITIKDSKVIDFVEDLVANIIIEFI